MSHLKAGFDSTKAFGLACDALKSNMMGAQAHMPPAPPGALQDDIGAHVSPAAGGGAAPPRSGSPARPPVRRRPCGCCCC